MGTLKRIIFALMLLFFFSSLTKNFFEYRKNLNFYASFKNEYEKEKKKNISLKTQALKQSDPNEVEKTIRNKLNMGKPNEVAVILPTPTPTPTVFIPTPAPVYQQWINVFFKQ